MNKSDFLEHIYTFYKEKENPIKKTQERKREMRYIFDVRSEKGVYVNNMIGIFCVKSVLGKLIDSNYIYMRVHFFF